MQDLTTGCFDTDTGVLALMPPEAGYDTGFVPPRPRLTFTPATPCMYGPVKFNIDQTLPGCVYERAWINYDSACGSWTMLDTIKKPRILTHTYSNICDSSGWITVGLIIKNGSCYDTAWYHHLFRLIPKVPNFRQEILSACQPYKLRFIPIDTVQYQMRKSIWGKTHLYHTGPFLIPWANIQVAFPYFFDSTIIANNDSIIPSLLKDSFALSGVYYITHLLYDTNGCGLTSTNMFPVGNHGFFTASKEITCVNSEVTLLDEIHYFDINSLPFYLSQNSEWRDPLRAAAGKERIWWDIGDGKGFSLTGPTPKVKYSKPGNYTIKMAWADSLGCMDTIVSENFIRVVETVALIKSLPSTFFCAPQIIQFKDSSYIIDSAAAISLPPFDTLQTWLWIFDDNKPNSMQQNPAHNFSSNGVFRIKLIATSGGGCADTAEVVIDMKGPQPSFSIASDTIGCAPFTVKFDNTTQKKLLNWTWFFGDNNVRPVVNDSDVLHTYINPGTYQIRLLGQDTVFNPTTGNMLTCNAFFPDTNTNIPSRTVYVLPKAPLSLMSKDSICPNEEVIFTAIADTLYKTFYWQFGDGDTLTTKRPDTLARHTYTSSGSYQVILAPRLSGKQICIDTAFKTIFVAQVKADFDIDERESPLYRFKNKSSNEAVRYLWNFGDEASGSSNNSLLKDPIHTFSVSRLDTFMVCLWAYNADDCEDSVCKPVVLGARVKIPNVFTPDNGDQVNDAFDIDIEGWKLYDLIIYNRWGNKVFEGNKDGFGNDGVNWNGRVDNTGAECPAGVYYFIFNYHLTTESSPKTVTGTVTLIR